MWVTDEMIDRALAVNIDLIQGFTYPEREFNTHVIRDFRTDYHRGVEVWAGTSHIAMTAMLRQLKMAAQIGAALLVSPHDTPGAKVHD